MIRIVAVIRKKPELSREQFLRFWHDEHPAYVRKLPRLRRYRQNPSIEHRKEWPFDGIAELWFDTVQDIAVAYSGSEAEELRRHEDLFLDDMQWSIVEEQEIDLAPETSDRSEPSDTGENP